MSGDRNGGVLILDGESLTVEDVARVSEGEAERVELDPAALARVARSADLVKQWGEQRHPIYGVNTGFGELIHVGIPPKFARILQENLIRSHAAGAGQLLSREAVRATMIARLNCLMKGRSGVRPAVVELLSDLINRHVCPAVPEQGSLGASGDLAPLSHIACVMIGEGEVLDRSGSRIPARNALKAAGLEPIELEFKEGLALVNGTSAMTGCAALALVRADRLLQWALAGSAAVVEVLRASTRAFDERGHAVKNHPGQIWVAAMMRRLLKGSALTREHRDIMNQVTTELDSSPDVASAGVYLQNAYSLRCMPQVLGPVAETLCFVRRIVENELNSCNDNPLVFDDDPYETFHGANFHGQYVAMAADYLNIALTEIGVLAERQLNRLVDPHLNGSLPDFLASGEAGLFCGFEGAQYLATSIASENLNLAAPASVKSLPSNGSNQDIVSMGLIAARKSLQLSQSVETILVVLLGAAAQAYLLGYNGEGGTAIHKFAHRVAETLGVYDDGSPMYTYLDGVRQLAHEEWDGGSGVWGLRELV